jgi:uncharacterized membrane protein YphA (DoxX/SURF4 family)
MNVPERAASQALPARRGSVLLGVGLAWLTMIAGYGLLIGVSSFAATRSAFSLGYSIPWVIAVLLIIWLVATRRTRTAIGVAIGLVTVFVACVVLFVLLAQGISNNFR